MQTAISKAQSIFSHINLANEGPKMFDKLVVALMMLSLPSISQSAPDIDLVGAVPHVRAREPRTTTASGGAAGGLGWNQTSPIAVSIVSAEPISGGGVRLLIKVQNTTTNPVEIPDDPDLADFEPPDASTPYAYRSLSIVPIVHEKGGQDRQFTSVFLYGSEEHPSTLRNLAPSDSITIRFEAQVKTGGPKQQIEIQSQSLVRVILTLRQESVVPQHGQLHQDSTELYPAVNSEKDYQIQP